MRLKLPVAMSPEEFQQTIRNLNSTALNLRKHADRCRDENPARAKSYEDEATACDAEIARLQKDLTAAEKKAAK